MEMMEQAPERIAGLALLDTNPKAETAEVVRAGNLRSGKCAGGGFLEVMRDEIKPNYLADAHRHQTLMSR